MHLHFYAISEPTLPGLKWQNIFNAYWPAYRVWLDSNDAATSSPDLKTSYAALKYYMPEMLPTYERLCILANADEKVARFLTGFQPPAYISACSQAVTTKGTVQLVRNYDYHPALIDGTMLMSAWNGKKVIANTGSMVGILDGMNEDGLAVSLTFGGRQEVGKGFGITFILRYVLEFCSNVAEAVDVLTRVPSHMSYNVTVVDRSGTAKTVQLAPDKAPFVSDAVYTTNHQGVVDWPENAQFNKTIERAEFLENQLSQDELNPNQLVDSFLQPPLYNTHFKEGFGTLYTAIYRPEERTVKMRWPNEMVLQSFDDFQEQHKLIIFQQSAAVHAPIQRSVLPNQKNKEQMAHLVDWQEEIPDDLINEMGEPVSTEGKERLKILRKNMLYHGQVSWEILAEYWSILGREYWDKWQK